MRSADLLCWEIMIIDLSIRAEAHRKLGFASFEFQGPERRFLPETLDRVMTPVSTICANDCGGEHPARPSVTAVHTPAYRVFLNLPEEPHRLMAERARATRQNTSELYETALCAFARNLACGVRLPLAVAATGLVGVYVQLPAERRRWLRRLSSRLSLSESDIVAAAADWLLAGGSLPTPAAVYDRSRQPASTHDPPG
jgi:hypothetical protein